MKVLTYFDERPECGIDTGDQSLVEQHHKNEVDINQIVARARRSGVMPRTSFTGQYGDFTDVTDFAAAKNRIIEAEAAFMALPVDVRNRFKNDVGSLLSFLDDEKNYDEAMKLGLIARPVPDVVDKTTDVVQKDVSV